MITADTLVCIDYVSAHGARLHGSTMADSDRWIDLAPGDCYQSSGGEKVKIKIAHPYRVDANADGTFAKKVYKKGTYKVKDKKNPHGLTVRIR